MTSQSVFARGMKNRGYFSGHVSTGSLERKTGIPVKNKDVYMLQ